MDSATRPTTLGDLLKGVGGVAYRGCDPATPVSGLVMDSRRARAGNAFVAVVGATVDGHEYVGAARARGATVAVVQAGTGVPEPTVVVPDTSVALPDLAANLFGRPAESLSLAGVTGTNGKTTTAHLLAAVLRHAGLAHVRLGTTGNWLVDHEDSAGFTTPFPLELQGLLRQAVDAGATHGVMEVSSHALAQGRASGIPFRAVGLTSFSQDHLDFHPDMESYLAAKCRLPTDHLRADGVAVAAVDGQPASARFLGVARDRGARCWRASRGGDPNAEILARTLTVDAGGIRMEVSSPAGDLTIPSPLVGQFNADNLLVTAGLALGLGLGPAQVEAGLAGATGAPGRLEAVGGPGRGPRVFVDYAHTPDAVRNVLRTLRPLTPGRLIVVLGCGGDRDRAKRPLMGEVAATASDLFYATSDNPRTEEPGSIVEQMLEGVPPPLRGQVVREVSRERAIRQAIVNADEADTVLLAGKGHEDYQILGTEKIHFDDREHAAAALRARAGDRERA